MRAMKRAVFAAVVAVSILASSRPLRAAPCDNASDAWTAVSRAADALDGGRTHEAERYIAPLLATESIPAGTQIEWIARARAEAQLIQFQIHARPLVDRLAHPPRPPSTARDRHGFDVWMRSEAVPWIGRVHHDLDALQSEAQPLLRAENGSLALRVEASAIMTDLFSEFSAVVRDMPL